MTILHLNSEREWRGGEQQLAYLIDNIQAEGIKSIVVCRKHSFLENYCVKHQFPHFGFRLTNGFNLKEAMSLVRICRQKKVDLIHAHDAKVHTLAVLAASLGNKPPVVLSRRVAFPVRNNYFTQWKYNHPVVKKIICISETVREVVARSIVATQRLVVVYSGINVHRFTQPSGYLRKKYSILSDKPLVGNVAALSDSKDLYTFVDAAGVLLKTGLSCHFVIMGEGPERERLQEYIRENGISQHITLTGFLSNLDEVLPELDVFLTTAKIEGLGTSVLDAFACRVPVVATRAGGIPEMVIHQKTGLLADVGDAGAIAQHVKTLLEEPNLSKQITKTAYQYLLSHFTKEKMAQGILEVYQSVLTNTIASDPLGD